MPDVDVVTGAFSYSGSAIARQLAEAGRRVRTLTGHPRRAPADSDIEVLPLDFADRSGLARAMSGADTLYNTYWVRFAHGGISHSTAVDNTKILLEAAKQAGVRRIVHVSITNPALDSPYPYFRGKAEIEQALAGLGVPYAVARPAILFGGNGVLINNVAWLLRHLPVFAIGGRGEYQIRGVHVDDLARLCVELGRGTETAIVDAVGPERLTFRQIAETVRSAVGSNARIITVPEPLLTALSWGLGVILRDRLLTREEYQAMAAGLADSSAPSTGTILLSEWITAHAQQLGLHYANELHRHFTPDAYSGRE